MSLWVGIMNDMLIRKAYKFRLKTNNALEQNLFQSAGCTRWVWNHVWHMNQRRLTEKQKLIWYQEAAFWLTRWKQSEEYGFLRDCPSQALQQTLRDLERAYKDGFDKKQPLKRMPRKKRRGMDVSFRYPQGIRVDNRRVFLPKIGWVGFYKSQVIEGNIKSATVSYKAGHWYVSIQVEQALAEPCHPETDAVGIDMGITRFATLSTGDSVNPINAVRHYEQRLARAQRQLSRKVKFSANWHKQKQRISKIHQAIANTRNDFLHKESLKISKNHAMIFVEDLKVSNMSRSAKGDRAKSGLNKAILDQGWAEFRRQLDYNSQWQGGMVVAVPAHHTSQACHQCGHTTPDNRRSQSHFECMACGHTDNADVNAAKNILARGHRVLACGGTAQQDRPVKQESVESREAMPPATANAVVGITVALGR